MEQGNRKAVVAAMSANFGISLAKFAGYFVTGAASMLAEAIHSVADTGNQGLLLWGARAAGRDATPQHPFGYGRERYFWAFVVALVIFSLGGLFAIYEGVTKLGHPHPLTKPLWAIGILVVSIVLESGSFRVALREAKHQKGEESWWGFIRHTRNPELPVVLLEDLGAIFGLILALLGVGLALLTGNPMFDALGSIAIGIVLVAIGVTLAVEMKSLLLGESATASDEAAIRSAILDSQQVQRVLHMRTQHVGPDELLVGVKVEFAPDLTVAELTRAINAAEERIRARIAAARLIYLEPDVFVTAGD